MARPARDHDRNRQRIIDLSRELIAEHGVEAFSLGDVAAAAGITAPAIYHYFRDRRALLLEVLQAEVEEVVAATTVAETAAEQPLERLRDFLERQSVFLVRNRPGATAFLLSSLLEGRDDPEIGPVVSVALGAAEGFFREVVAEADARGDLASGLDVEGAVAVLRAGLAGMFLVRVLDERFDPSLAAARILEAVAAPEAEPNVS